MEYLKREEIFEYVKNQYGTVPEYLWETSPKSAVLRHKNGKWYAVLMQVEKSRLGLEEEHGRYHQCEVRTGYGWTSDTDLWFSFGISYE